MVTAILSAVVALFGLIGTALTSGVNSAKKENDSLKKENAQLRAELAAAKEAASAKSSEDTARREKVIADLKAEIESLMKDHEANKDPAAVRARLNGLFDSVP